MTINELGDMEHGCDSLGDTYNPDGQYGQDGHLTHIRPGVLDFSLVDQQAKVNLSGSDSVVGRSIVITNKVETKDYYGRAQPDKRVGCCVIGLSKGAKAAAPTRKASVSGTPIYKGDHIDFSKPNHY